MRIYNIREDLTLKPCEFNSDPKLSYQNFLLALRGTRALRKLHVLESFTELYPICKKYVYRNKNVFIETNAALHNTHTGLTTRYRESKACIKVLFVVKITRYILMKRIESLLKIAGMKF